MDPSSGSRDAPRAADPLDLVGDVLDGQFRVEEFVGEGALSVVYRARSEPLDAPVAVKCLDLPPTLDGALASSVVESFQEGCKLHYRLARGHLAIAQTFASGTTVAPRTGAHVPYIVREWFEGESLARDLRRRRAEGESGRTLAETLALFEPVASALAYAHAQGAEHLSLMPSNLFLAKKEGAVSLKVLDFGVGRVVDDVASSRSGPTATAPPRVKLLLPTYAAPEQLLGTLGPTGPWTDVYALALVLLEVLADRPVMAEKDATAIVARALNKTLRPTPAAHGVTLPPEVDAILTRALALEPELRQGNVEELWEELAAATKPARSDRRKVAVHLRRLRRTRRVQARRRGDDAPTSVPPPSGSFAPEEPPTAKARGVVAMLTARAVRASTRPPPPLAPTHAPPAPTKAPPAPAHTTTMRAPAFAAAPTNAPPAVLPKKARAPTLVGIAPPPLPVRAEPAARNGRAVPHVATRSAAPPPEAPGAVVASTKPAPSKPPPALDLPSIIVSALEPPAPALTSAPAPAPTPVPAPAPAPAPAPIFPPSQAGLESSGRLEPHELPVATFAPSLFARVRAALLDRRLVALAGAGAVVFVATLVLVVVLATRSKTIATVPASSASATAASNAPTATDTASSPAAPTETSEPTRPPAPGVFEKRVALAAIAEATKNLSDCRRPHGVWGKGQTGVVFKNDGTVRYVIMSAPFKGPEGKCVAAHIKKARIDPFVGIIGPIYANFVIPY